MPSIRYVVFKGLETEDGEKRWTHICGVLDTLMAALAAGQACAGALDAEVWLHARWSVLVRSVGLDDRGLLTGRQDLLRPCDGDAVLDWRRPAEWRVEGTPARAFPAVADADANGAGDGALATPLSVAVRLQATTAPGSGWQIARLEAVMHGEPYIPLPPWPEWTAGLLVSRQLDVDADGSVSAASGGLDRLQGGDWLCRPPTNDELL